MFMGKWSAGGEDPGCRFDGKVPSFSPVPRDRRTNRSWSTKFEVTVDGPYCLLKMTLQNFKNRRIGTMDV